VDLKFKNRLTDDEIKEGVNLFIKRKVGYIFLIIIGIAIASVILNKGKSQSSQAFVGILVIGIFIFGLYLYLRKILMSNFSTEKIATYSFTEDGVDIVNDDGREYNYSYFKMKTLDSKNVLVLTFGKNSLAIISKDKLQPSEIEWIKGLE